MEINMSPLVDCVFLLLIFFIVTAVFVEETGVDVNRPRAVSAERLEKNSLLLSVSTEGAVHYGGREVPLNRVRGLVAQLLRDRDLPVIILADKSSEAGRLVEVIDECNLAGARRVSVAAARE